MNLNTSSCDDNDKHLNVKGSQTASNREKCKQGNDDTENDNDNNDDDANDTDEMSMFKKVKMTLITQIVMPELVLMLQLMIMLRKQ